MPSNFEQFFRGPSAALFSTFGEPVSFAPPGGPTSGLTAMVEPERDTFVEQDNGRVMRKTRNITFAVSDVGDPPRGSQITLAGGVVWEVDFIESSSAGMVTVVAVRPVPTEITPHGYRNRV